MKKILKKIIGNVLVTWLLLVWFTWAYAATQWWTWNLDGSIETRSLITSSDWDWIVLKIQSIAGLIKPVPIGDMDLVNKKYADALEMWTGSTYLSWTIWNAVVFDDIALRTWGRQYFCSETTSAWAFNEINDWKVCNYELSDVDWIVENLSKCWDADCMVEDNWGSKFCRNYDYATWNYVDVHNDVVCGSSKTCWDANCIEKDNWGDDYCRDVDHNSADLAFTEINDWNTCWVLSECWDANCIVDDKGGDAFCRDVDYTDPGESFTEVHYWETCSINNACWLWFCNTPKWTLYLW